MKFALAPAAFLTQQAVNEIVACNDITYRYGLALSLQEAQELAETNAATLARYGRIDFTGGFVRKLILAFCNSPFLTQDHYAEMLSDLLETFYYFKGETLEEIGDDELLAIMKEYFDINCLGCIELLQGRELEALGRKIREDMFRSELNAYIGEDYDE